MTAEIKKLTYEDVLSKSIEDVFNSFGEQVKQAIYRSLQTQYAVPKEQIPNRIDKFTVVLETIFGETAKLIELKILENLQHKVQNFQYKPKNYDVFFVDWLAAFRKYMDLEMVSPEV